MIQFRDGDSHLTEMERLLGEADTLAPGERTDLHFALGKAYDDLGRHAEAAQQWLQGNALKRREVSYDAAAMDEGFERIRNVFAQDWLETRQGIGHPSATPVFIIGMPRSGTTLVEQDSASHPQVFGGGEMKHFGAAVREIEATRYALYPDLTLTMTGSDFADLGGRYLTESRRLVRPDALHVTDKMPSNFLFAGLIHLSLPNAPIIHTVRDPVDTCLSCFSKLFTGELNYTYDLAELGRYYRQYQLLMAHWKRVLPVGRISRCLLRRACRGSRGPRTPHCRALRTGMGSALPVLSGKRQAGSHCQCDASASTGLQEFGRPLASLPILPCAVASGIGSGERYRLIATEC